MNRRVVEERTRRDYQRVAPLPYLSPPLRECDTREYYQRLDGELRDIWEGINPADFGLDRTMMYNSRLNCSSHGALLPRNSATEDLEGDLRNKKRE